MTAASQEVRQVGRDPTPTFWDMTHRQKGGLAPVSAQVASLPHSRI